MFNIVLVHPDIPQNTGNIGRLCVGLNAKLHLVRPMGFVIDDKKLKRAGLDYWQHLELTIHDSLQDFLEFSKSGNCYFLTTKTDKKYTDINFQKGDFLIFGAETRGLPEDLLNQNQDSCFTIPMFGKIRSLNLATSVGIVTYEGVRQVSE